MKRRSNVTKVMRINGQKPKMQRMEEVYGSMKSAGCNPQSGMFMLECFNGEGFLPASSFNQQLLCLGKKEARTIERILQNHQCIEPLIVFRDCVDGIVDAGDAYNNEQLIDMVYRPKNGASFYMLDPALYARRIPDESLSELFGAPRTIKTTVAAVLDSSGSGGFASEADLAAYKKRPIESRAHDAMTLMNLVSAYSWNKDPSAQEVGVQLARNFMELYTLAREVPLIKKLKKVMDHAATIHLSDEFAKLRDDAMAQIIRMTPKEQPGEDPLLDRVEVVEMDGNQRFGPRS